MKFLEWIKNKINSAIFRSLEGFIERSDEDIVASEDNRLLSNSIIENLEKMKTS
jgi:hypothetical protein